MEKQGSPCFSPHGNTQKMNEEHENMNEERGKKTLLRVIPTMAFQTCCVLLNSYQVSLGWNAVAKWHQQESNLIYAMSYDILSLFYLGISSEILCDWGPAGNTLIRSLQLRSGEERRKEEGGGGQADIKSNNPHLTGEQRNIKRWCFLSSSKQIDQCFSMNYRYMGMDQYLYIPFLGGWTSIYQLFWCSPGVQGFDTLPYLLSTFNNRIHLDPRRFNHGPRPARCPWHRLCKGAPELVTSRGWFVVSWGYTGNNYPLVNIQKAIENGPVEIVDLPSYIAWWFSIVTLVDQGVTKENDASMVVSWFF